MQKVLTTLVLLFVTMVSFGQSEPSYKDVLALAKAGTLGSLGTISAKDPSQPVVSAATLMLRMEQKELIFYLNRNAGHSLNMARNERISFMLSGPGTPGDDPNNRPRVTFLGKSVVVKESDPDYETIKKAYFKKYPGAETYEDAAAFHQFQFVRLVPEKITYIGSFGNVFPSIDVARFWIGK